MSFLPKISPASQPLSNEKRANGVERIPAEKWLVLVAGLAYLIFAYLLIRAWCLLAAADPLWLDELHTDWLVSGRFGEIFGRSLRWNQTPMYFWLEWIVVQSAGNSALGLRFISLVSISLTVLATAFVIGRWTGDWLVAFATSGIFAAVSPIAFYASEARPYALLMLVGFLQSVWLVAGIQRTLLGWSVSWKYMIGGLLLTTMVVAIHPVGFVLLFIQVSISVLFLIGRSADRGTTLLLSPWPAVVVGSLLSALWLFGLRGTMEHRQAWSVTADLPGLLVWAGWLGLWLVVPSGIAFLFLKTRKTPGPNVSALILTAFGWGGVVGILVCHQGGIFPVASVRYAMVFLPLIFLGWGLLLARLKNLIARVGLIGLAAFGLLILSQPVWHHGKTTWNKEPNWSIEATLTGAVRQWRAEDWEFAREIFEKAPGENGPAIVLLCGNVLEDARLSSNTGHMNELISRELVFPLARFSSGSPDAIAEVKPRATLQGPRFLPKDYDDILRAEKAFLVMRCEPLGSLHDEILNELRHGFASRGYTLETRIQSNPGFVPVFVELYTRK
ncbi:MAG: hypothetical protein KF851_05670 [Pirellulaceae bacterium]|nr:hypothetical protein [Pirellulaceae bacterium]